MIVSAGSDLDATALEVRSDKGSVALAAKNDVNLTAASEAHTWTQDTKKKTSSTFSSKSTRTHDETDDVYAIGSRIKAGDGVSTRVG